MPYRMNDAMQFDCGFSVSATQLVDATEKANNTLKQLPFALYQHVDYKTTSSIIGALFAADLAKEVGAFVNPIEKGHPDIIPVDGKNCTEQQLRNYPEGLEIKCTVGNISKGANLRAGQTRIDSLTGITWQAHHREVASLLGIVWDFADLGVSPNFPIITGAFYANNLCTDDWGAISGTEGRNTKVSGMTASGKAKMGCGWALIYDNEIYLRKYSRLLGFCVV